jgi:hypothetical protein
MWARRSTFRIYLADEKMPIGARIILSVRFIRLALPLLTISA